MIKLSNKECAHIFDGSEVLSRLVRQLAGMLRQHGQHSGSTDDSVRYFGSAEHPVPHQMADTTIPNTSATEADKLAQAREMTALGRAPKARAVPTHT